MERFTVIFWMSILLVSSLFAGAEMGVIEGRVIDSLTKKPLANVNVTVMDEGTGSATNDNGEFRMSNLPAGLHSLKVEMVGYCESVVHNLRVKPNAVYNIDLELTQTVIELESVTVTATREKSLLWDVPVSASVISSSDLERRNSTTLGQALQEVGSAFVKSYGIAGAMETLSLRGSLSEQVLVLWDGQRLNSPLTGGLDLGTISLQPIERIEIVHGGYSSLYGADAMAGVVNLITRSPQLGAGLQGSIHTLFGSYSFQRYDLNFSQGLGKWSYILSANTTKSDGDFEYTPANKADGAESKTVRRENSDLNSKSLFGKATWNASPTTTLRFSGELVEVKRGVPGTLSYPTVNGRQEDESKRIHGDFETTPLSTVTLRASAYYHKQDIHYVDENPYFAIDSQNDAESYGTDFQGHVKMGRHNFLLGGSYLIEATQGSDVGIRKRKSSALFTQGELDLLPPRFSHNLRALLMPSIRYDRFSDFGDVINPKVGLLISKFGTTPIALRMSWGKSFRAPTFNDLYWPEDMFTVGNPNLRPEKATSKEIGLRASLPIAGGLELNTSYFDKEAEDLIQWTVDQSSGKWTPKNVSAAQISGIELSVLCRGIGKLLTTEISYSRLNSKNRSGIVGVDGKELPYRPKHNGSLVTSVNLRNTIFTITARYVGERFINESNSEKLDSHVLIDGDVGIKQVIAGLRFNLGMSVKNIFDKQYEIVKDYPMPGRLWQVKLGIGF